MQIQTGNRKNETNKTWSLQVVFTLQQLSIKSHGSQQDQGLKFSLDMNCIYSVQVISQSKVPVTGYRPHLLSL